jgi:hypothetical protein
VFSFRALEELVTLRWIRVAGGGTAAASFRRSRFATNVAKGTTTEPVMLMG